MSNFLRTLLIALSAWPVASPAQPAAIDIPTSPIPIQILVQSPAETNTDLQVICLFRSSPLNTLHGSLIEINDKIAGLLDRVRKPDLFRGEAGETLLMIPPDGSLKAKKLLIIGLGDSQTFTPDRMVLVGEIAYVEASRLGVAHPYFAPTVLDGGVSKFSTAQVAEQVIRGFLRAAATAKVLHDANAAPIGLSALTFLAGAQHASDTRAGIEKAVAGASQR